MPDAGAPVESADITTIEDYTISKPMCILAQAAAQNITNNTDTAITFGSGSETVDTHGFHDETTNNSRITPNVAGWYFISGTFFISADNDYTTLTAFLRTNGSTVLRREAIGPNTTSASRSVSVQWWAQFNGTTDYVELMASQINTSAATNATPGAGSFGCRFAVVFERPL